VLREEPRAVVVPREAVQSTSDAHFVFVRDRDYLKEGHPKVFHVRQVRLGAGDEQSVELLAGALPGEVVATKGSGVLLAQLLKSNLGAGCGCHKD
jgi:cobalt-zinc-cadmium efflux system membrane fusion protein